MIRPPGNLRGFALILVVVVLGLAAMLGYAILESASTSAQIEKNVTAAAQAESLAESGVNLAMYYLLNPDQAPTLNASGFWPGGTDVSLGGTTKIDRIQIDEVEDNTYQITCTSRAGGVDQTIRAVVFVKTDSYVKHAMAANSDLDLSKVTGAHSRIEGDLLAKGIVKMPSVFNLVTGVLQAVGANVSGWTALPSGSQQPVPLFNELEMVQILPYYKYKGRIYIAEELKSDPTGNIVTAKPSMNPANVWYSTKKREFKVPISLNGTLIMTDPGEELKVNAKLTVRPKEEMPALLVAGEIRLDKKPSELDVVGLVYVGKKLKSTDGEVSNKIDELLGLEPIVTILGSLMLANTKDDDAIKDYRGEITLIHDKSKVNLPNLGKFMKTPVSVRVIEWK